MRNVGNDLLSESVSKCESSCRRNCHAINRCTAIDKRCQKIPNYLLKDGFHKTSSHLWSTDFTRIVWWPYEKKQTIDKVLNLYTSNKTQFQIHKQPHSFPDHDFHCSLNIYYHLITYHLLKSSLNENPDHDFHCSLNIYYHLITYHLLKSSPFQIKIK